MRQFELDNQSIITIIVGAVVVLFMVIFFSFQAGKMSVLDDCRVTSTVPELGMELCARDLQ